MAHGCRRQGEKATRECVWLRTDLNTTSPFQRAHRWTPHKSLRQQHGPGNECIDGCQKRLEAAAQLRPASAKCHTNLNDRNSAHSSKFHSSLTAALRLEPACSSPDATRLVSRVDSEVSAQSILWNRHFVPRKTQTLKALTKDKQGRPHKCALQQGTA